jgi:co-chaperonin GroES (HSP10)
MALGTGWSNPQGGKVLRFEVQVGDRVYFPKAAVEVVDIQADDRVYYLVPTEWLHAVIEDNWR